MTKGQNVQWFLHHRFEVLNHVHWSSTLTLVICPFCTWQKKQTLKPTAQQFFSLTPEEEQGCKFIYLAMGAQSIAYFIRFTNLHMCANICVKIIIYSEHRLGNIALFILH